MGYSSKNIVLGIIIFIFSAFIIFSLMNSNPLEGMATGKDKTKKEEKETPTPTPKPEENSKNEAK
jgi:hypothetical protein